MLHGFAHEWYAQGETRKTLGWIFEKFVLCPIVLLLLILLNIFIRAGDG